MLLEHNKEEALWFSPSKAEHIIGDWFCLFIGKDVSPSYLSKTLLKWKPPQKLNDEFQIHIGKDQQFSSKDQIPRDQKVDTRSTLVHFRSFS